MTVYVHLFRPEAVDQVGISKLARNYRAVNDPLGSLSAFMERLHAYPEDRWVALESRVSPSVSVHDYDWKGVYAQGGIHIVIGSMNHGVPSVVLDRVHDFVHIPQYDDVPFLAPHTALAIALHEHFRKVHNRSGASL